MPHRATMIGLLIATLLLSAATPAPLPWVGRWFYSAAESRHSPITITLTDLPGGRLRVDDGSQVLVLDRAAKPTPTSPRSPATLRTDRLTPTAFSYTKMIGGRPVERVEQRLGPDRTRLFGRRTVIAPDGKEQTFSIVSLRGQPAKGLAGAWRELPPAHDTVREGASNGPRRPYWIVSQDADGVMTWRVEPTGEVLKGRADGRRYPVIGPRQPAGRTFNIKVLGLRHLQFFIYDNGRLIVRTDETLSVDGKRWVDQIWTPAHPDEKDRLVYHRD